MSQSHKCPVVQRWHSYLEDLSLANYFESWLWYLAAKKKKKVTMLPPCFFAEVVWFPSP